MSENTRLDEEQQKKQYMLIGIETAMHLLRPNASWEICDGKFTRWDDPRPCPTFQDVVDTMEKIKAFEDSIDTIWLDEDFSKAKDYQRKVEDNILK